jgi:uncharacterized membrane protein
MDDGNDVVGLHHDADDPRLGVPERNPSLAWTINLDHRYGRVTLTLIVLGATVPVAIDLLAVSYSR